MRRTALFAVALSTLSVPAAPSRAEDAAVRTIDVGGQSRVRLLSP